VYNFINDVNNKTKFDKTFERGYDVLKINDNFLIQYHLYKGVFMISPRDFVMLRYQGCTPERAFLYMTSIKCDKIPEVKKVVRAELLYGGNIIERIDDNKCRLTLFSVVDILF
jgi:hypothetical protein